MRHIKLGETERGTHERTGTEHKQDTKNAPKINIIDDFFKERA